MRNDTVCRWLFTAVALIFSATASAQVRISEFHYDNTGADTGEAVEVSAPAGTDLTGWQVVLYNGAATSRASYSTRTLAGAVRWPSSGMPRLRRSMALASGTPRTRAR